jgi:hypothetical protein
MWCLYGLETTGHFVALIDFADSKRKKDHQRYLMGFDLVFAPHTLAERSNANEQGKCNSS